MVRKKVAGGTVDEADKNNNIKKTKKKSAIIADDEYMVAEEITEATEVPLESNASVSEKGEEQLVEANEGEDNNHGSHIVKLKSQKQTANKEDFTRDEAFAVSSRTLKSSIENSKKKDKKGKKNPVVQDDEYALEDATSINAPDAVNAPDAFDPNPFSEDHVPVVFLGKKKAKKNKDTKKNEEADERTADLDSPHVLSTATDVFDQTNDSDLHMTSTLNQGKGGGDAAFELLEEASEYTLTELSKLSVSTATMESERLNGNFEDDMQFADKRRGKKPRKPAKFSDFDELEAILTQVDGKDSEKNGLAALELNDKHVSAQLLTHSTLEVDDDEILHFTGKKKGKKGKLSASKVLGGDDNAALPEVDVAQSPRDADALEVVPSRMEMLALENAASEDVTATTKKKLKKAKKGGRTVQEEEDLDAILAELDGPKSQSSADTVKTIVSNDHTQPLPLEDVEGTDLASVSGLVESEEVVESAAAKKKKKKKEKEKAKSAVEKHDESAVQEEKDQHDEPAKTKVADKKVPKHVREMQERLSKMKEAEEKRKREEEEKRKKEEEELRRLEELERQKEEAKRRRKEREKEKLQQKKLEGKLLTGKQKEEARRLAMMREQFLAQKGISGEGELVPKTEAAVPKKPKYDTKKKKRLPASNVGTSEGAVSQADIAEEPELLAGDVEDEAIADNMSEDAEEVAQDEKLDIVEEDKEAEEEDWDAKSWEASIKLPAIKSAFAEEDGDFDRPASKTEKKTKTLALQPSVAIVPTSPSMQTSSSTKFSRQKSSQSVVEVGSEDETESEDDNKVKKVRDAKEKREARKADALRNRSADDLRSPICCILGHVDTGKTKLLDCIRRTNVQEGEAGGITQQIGATYFPMDNIRERTKELKADAKMRVPGLLVIDTPGHESFTNLRARGSSLCDIAILVIDIMHGLEPQTIESLNLLKLRQTPFVVALNKVDRLYDWKPCIGAPIKAALKHQTKDVVSEFETRLSQIVTQLKEQGLNSELYYRNKELRKFISIVPTSAISGEGIPDLLLLLVQLTQKHMEDKLMYVSELQCTVLEVKVVEGLGTTIDVVLVNGILHEGDQIVLCGMQGPIVTTIRALLTPHPMKELRVKGTYQHHKELKAAQGIKITAQGLEHAIAGTQLYVVGPDDELEDIKEEAMQDMQSVMSRVDKSGEGVCVQASTLGSLEALLEYLKSPAVKIPVSGISIGPVHKKDVMRASVMLEKKKKEYATILAFDVKVTPEAKELAEELGVRIFMADIIYHLFDQFTAYMNNVKEDKRKGAAEEAVFPCVLKILPMNIFNKKDPIVVGVDVVEGIAKVGTPLCVPSRENIDIGRIASLEINHKAVETAKKGQSVAMKIVGTNAEESQKMFGRHFDENDELVSRITRNSIDLLKESYRDDLTIEEWRLVVKLKKLFEIA